MSNKEDRMERTKINVAVGLFLVVGILALAYLSIRLGKVPFLGGSGYVVSADFPSVGGLKAGSSVEIAGVQIGRVESIGLADYQGRVVLRLDGDVKIQEDSIASIKTKGLIGEKYIRISPGGSDKIIPPNGRIREVEPPVDLEELISKYIFGKV
jgi:phospholipid/cholesterol/gamma-HCH transport system substrate-binding protein